MFTGIIETVGRVFRVGRAGVAIDGIALTAVGIDTRGFDVALIPYTLSATNLADRRAGDRVNLEADVLGTYVRRYLERVLPGTERRG